MGLSVYAKSQTSKISVSSFPKALQFYLLFYDKSALWIICERPIPTDFFEPDISKILQITKGFRILTMRDNLT